MTTPTPAHSAKLQYCVYGAYGQGCPGTGTYSLSSSAGSVLTIVNNSGVMIRVWWLDQAGGRANPDPVGPGQTANLQSKIGYSYVATNDSFGGCVDVFTISSAQAGLTVS